MSANRVIPYGYTVENGRNIPHPTESEIVRRIFIDYLSGASLLTMAQALTAERVEFIPGRSDWNKNRVKRILEDARYIGIDTYHAVISEDVYRQAQEKKDANNRRQKEREYPFRPSCPVECAVCGAVMKRRHDVRHNVPHDIWTCQNSGCHAIIALEDGALQKHITQLLNRLIANPGLVVTEYPHTAETPEVRRMANEAERELDALAFDRDRATQAVFALASERYRHIDSSPYQGHIIRAAFEKSEPLSSFSPSLFKRTVLKIQLGYGVTRLVLKNYQHIERSAPNADSNRPDPTAII